MKPKDFIGSSLYLDTNVFIYFVEGHPAHKSALTEIFLAVERSDVRVFTSELSLAEVLVKPLQERKSQIAEAYRKLLSRSSGIEVLAVERDVLEASAAVRAEYGGRAFDAIHIATALKVNCRFLISEDTRLKLPPHIKLVRVSEIAAGE